MRQLMKQRVVGPEINTFQKNIKNSSLKSKLNLLSCYIICFWMGTPSFANSVGVIGITISFLLWLITSDIRWMLGKLPPYLLYLFIFFSSFVPYLLSGTLRYGGANQEYILVQFPLFFVGAILVHYYLFYKKDYDAIRKIVLSSIFFFMVGSIQTIIGLSIFPAAARELAASGRIDAESAEIIRRLGIGDFGFIYSIVFLAIPLLYLLTSQKLNVGFRMPEFYLLIIGITIFYITIIKASYTIALILSVLGSVLVMLLRKNNPLLFIIIIILGFLTFLLKEFLGELLIYVANNVLNENPYFSVKLEDLGSALISGINQNSQTGNRVNLYMQSLQSFLYNPLFGMYGPLSDGNISAGGHSSWFDILAYYGLLSGIPLFLFFKNYFKKISNLYTSANYGVILLIVYAIFIVLGFINPILGAYRVGFIVLFILPLIPFSFKKDIKFSLKKL